MDEADRETIRRNIVALSDDMDFDSVSTTLYSKGIFEKDHIEEFESKPSKKKKNRALLLDIERKGPDAFKDLVESLIQAKQGHLAKLLRPSSATQPLGSTHAATLFENKSKFGQPTSQPAFPHGNADDVSSQMDASPSNPDENYKMSSKPLGIALIINNKTFEKMPLRNGTDTDCKALENTFKHLGFSVTIKDNLTGEKMKGIIDELSKYNHSSLDCMILAILTHGNEGVVYGTDSGEVKIEDVFTKFNADQCETLRGKPKLFFIQACRGTLYDTGVESPDGVGPAGDGRTKNNLSALKKEAHRVLRTEEVDSTDGLGSVKSKLPKQTDMLLGYSTIPGFVSWRNNENGSWFIQSLTEVVLHHAKEEDLVSMMTRVHKRVASKESSTNLKCKQTSVFVSTLVNKVYFFQSH